MARISVSLLALSNFSLDIWILEVKREQLTTRIFNHCENSAERCGMLVGVVGEPEPFRRGVSFAWSVRVDDVDERGNLIVDALGRYVPRRVPRRGLPPLPDFHALRHSAAMECEDAEEARDLLRHRN